MIIIHSVAFIYEKVYNITDNSKGDEEKWQKTQKAAE